MWQKPIFDGGLAGGRRGTAVAGYRRFGGRDSAFSSPALGPRLPPRHCEEPLRRSNPESFRGGSLDCFAALAMTENGATACRPYPCFVIVSFTAATSWLSVNGFGRKSNCWPS